MTTAQTPELLKEVDHVVWVVNNTKDMRKGWQALGFQEIQELKKVKLVSHGHKDDKGSIRASVVNLGGLKAMWVQPVNGETIFSRALDRNGEGAVAMIHRVRDEDHLFEVTQQYARNNIGKLGTYTLETDEGDMFYTIMDTKEQGKYYLGFVIDNRTSAPPFSGKNQLDMQFSQYAFAIKSESSVSSFWMKAGFPEMEVTHNPVWGKEYFGKLADFDMKLGWMRHGSIVYEWCIPIKPPNVYADHIRIHGEGIQHFGYRVSDMEKAIAHFEAQGYKVSMSGGWGTKGEQGSGRFAYIDLNAIGGMTIELLWSYKP